LGDAPVVPRGIAGSWDDRFTDPGAVVYYDGMFHMFRNGFRGFPAASQVGYVTAIPVLGNCKGEIGYAFVNIGRSAASDYE